MKVKCMELIKDWSLWPRYEANDLDATNLLKLKEALRAGEVLPSIVVDKKSMRIIDGFHRVDAHLSVYGENAEIEATFREFKNDIEMFMESARMNTIHGLPLSPKDKVHVMLKARRHRIPLKKMADILGMTHERARQLMEGRTATTSNGKKIPLSHGASALAGKTLTKKEEKFARTSNGILPIVNARLLMNALRANCFPLTKKEVEVLIELRGCIDEVLAKQEVAA